MFLLFVMQKMKQNTFIIIFVGINFLFIVLHIHKHTMLIKISYQKQRLKKEQQELREQKNRSITQLYELQQPSNIKQFAQEHLVMKPFTLDRVKKITIPKK